MSKRRSWCAIYDKRPQFCKDYPQLLHYKPNSCPFYFIDGERRGFCEPDCDSECCRVPRSGGEPEGHYLPASRGGLPCRYIRPEPEVKVLAKTEQPVGQSSLKNIQVLSSTRKD